MRVRGSYLVCNFNWTDLGNCDSIMVRGCVWMGIGKLPEEADGMAVEE